MNLERLLFENDIRLQTKSLLLGGIVILILTQFRFHLVNLVALSILVYFIINLYLAKEYSDTNNFNTTTRYKLEKIQQNMNNYIRKRAMAAAQMMKPTEATAYIKNQVELAKLLYLYTDVNFIHFLDNIEYFYTRDPRTYISIVKAVNNILQLREDSRKIVESTPKQLHEFEKRQLFYNFEETERLGGIVSNHFHSFIYNIPKSNVSYQYHHQLSQRLGKLLLGAKKIQRYYITQSGALNEALSNSTRFLPNEFVHTKPYIPPSSQFEYNT